MSPPPARVLYVHHRSELGGAPTSLYYVIRELDRARFEPHVYCPPGAAAELFASAGATVHTGTVAGFTHIWASVYRGRRWALLVRELARLPGHLWRFRRLLRRGRFDLVHVNDSPPVAAAWLAWRARIPVVWHLRSAPPADGTDRRSRFLRRCIERFASAVVAINRDVARVFDVDADIVPNAIDLDLFAPGDRTAARAAAGLDASGPVVSYFGFLYPAKGFREFIEAAALVREREPEATFLVVGGGVRSREFFRSPAGRFLELLDLAPDYESQARELVAERGLERVVRFVPFTREPERLYRASDVVVAPSKGAELGRPVIEAAASGVPVVVSGSHGGGGIVIPDRTGLLVERADPRPIAEAIAELLAHPERAAEFGRAARAHAEAEFAPSGSARRIEAIYERVLGAQARVRVLYVEPGRAETFFRPLAARLGDRFAARRYGGGVLGLASELRRRDFSVVHVAGARAATVGWLARRRGASVVLQVTDSAAAFADALVTADPWLVRHVDGAQRVVVAPEVVDPPAAGRDEQPLTVGLVTAGRAHTWEACDFERAVRLARLRTPFRAVVHAEAVASTVEADRVEGTREDYLVRLDIAVVPDRAATRASVEAAAAGCAVVAATSPGGGPLGGDAALLTPPRAPAALAAAVALLVADDRLRAHLAAAARAAVSPDDVVARLEALYLELIA